MNLRSIQLIESLWLAKQAVENGFVAPEDCLTQLFQFLDAQTQDSFGSFLEEAGLVTAFQQKKLTERVQPLLESLQGTEHMPEHAEEHTLSSSESVLHARYSLGPIIQQGGVGRIYKAYDRVVGRDVAIKCLIDPKSEHALRRFENEYKITGGLDHPNIISVHDACHSEELGPFYVMRLLEGRTLREVLCSAHEKGTPGRTALLRIFLDVCAAVAFAHTHGIVHRDLKPSNIMVGELGEVQVMDWGIACRLFDPNLPTPQPEKIHSKSAPKKESIDSILGTPGYMAPEQTRENESVDARADIFSLGCILYEMLTFQFPFGGTRLDDYLLSLKQGAPTPPSEMAPAVEDELNEIVMRALEMERQKRYTSVRDMSAALSLYLEGTRTQKIRDQRALSKVTQGIQARASMQQSEQRAEAILGQVRGAEAKIRPYDPLEKKRPVWSKSNEVEVLEKAAMVQLGEAITAFTQALALNPKHPEAHSQLADLYFERLLASERKRDGALIAYNEAMLQRHNDGRFDLFLKNEGSIWLLSDPPEASVTLHRLEESDLVLTPQESIDLKTTPVGPVTLSVGSYLAIFRKEGFVDTRVPIVVQRDKRNVFRARMYKPNDIPVGYTYVPQGRFQMGGDPHTASAGRTERPFIDDLFLSIFPVTMKEYLEFLNESSPEDPLLMQKHVPRRSPDGGFYLQTNDESVWVLPEEDEDGDTWDPQLPVLSISWYDADVYAQWKAEKEQLPLRLLQSAEFEKAARGVDGRYFPWGDRFDATFCKVGKSRPGPPKPEPVGSYPLDVSIYGVHDLAGGVREWCGDVMDDPEDAVAVGGHWSGTELTSRAAHRWHLQKAQMASGIGTRLCMDAPRYPYHVGFPEVEQTESLPLSLPLPKHSVSLPLQSTIRTKLADPKLWSALAENKEEQALSDLLLAVLNNGTAWAMVYVADEDIPLASMGDAPDQIPRSLLFSDPKMSSSTDLDNAQSTPFAIWRCGTHSQGRFIVPKEHNLSEEDTRAMLSAIALVLNRRSERHYLRLREQQTMQEVKKTQQQLTLVREALVTLGPETYLREAYPLIDGRSRAIHRLFRMLDRLSRSEVNVFIRGESGVGKERVALTIHQHSTFKEGPFVPVNCGAIPENLIESELFGHVKGAFTGAERDQLGLFRKAHGGTLFLDEVAELSLDAQVKLLRALQNRAVRPVGAATEIPFKARILAATHHDLKQRVEEGLFRSDLYWRLVVMEVEIPPLRERPEDIPILLNTFLNDWEEHIEISEPAMERFQAYTWPGNIRELENELRRSLVVADQVIEVQHLSRKLRDDGAKNSSKVQGTLKELVARVELDAIQLVLKQTNGNKSKTARVLGLSKRGLQLKMERYGLM